MTNANDNLHNAKNAKNDEFYTQLSDIEKELLHYSGHFKEKIVYCNCDDPTWSAFWKYFHINFTKLGLKKLVSTHYESDGVTYKMEYTGGDDDSLASGIVTLLYGNGDFRSQECLDILDETDIVVTNPPFSLFKEFLSVLMTYGKKFVIIGNLNAISYKETFHYIKNNKMWLGYGGNCTMVFRMPDYYPLKGTAFVGEDGHKYIKMGSCAWYTNLDIEKRHDDIILWKPYNDVDFPKYDNYDAINVRKTAEIPCDYYGEMGVPISFLNCYNQSQFEIIGLLIDYKGEDFIQGTPVYTDEKHKNSTCAVLNGKRQYAKILIKRRVNNA